MQIMLSTRLLSHRIMGIHRTTRGICNRDKIGNRDVVGYGLNGTYMYMDLEMCPFPAIRFRENTPKLMALREKERGDWRRLCLDEKKTLYRASFCQTFAEMDEPSSEWKSILGLTLLGVSGGLWLWIYSHIFVYKNAPISFSEERRAALYWRLKAIMHQPITGLKKPPYVDKYKPETMKED
ncbi:cytochrome c oxidase subunit 4 isoform 1, mitochondrial-like [Fopius arisanus]|uniref:Cytochrome c oxidase subunit 4 n=1 Tax=Fopius arisanus TaxID=64838 RepID=A0A9R1TII3_9HYME|nr:PREDICTED: cytochrome c oxidase subunit 4 isoform 1, mitochondrial-like [Fopius arisanus]